MNNTIGSNIKALRKAKGLTQEQLAEALGISFQAISKWEVGTGLPDITLIKPLASFFGVSCDKILGFDRSQEEAEIKKICYEAAAYRFNDTQKSRQMLEKGLERFPDNDIILNNILCTMDIDEQPDEVIAIAEKIIDRTSYPETKYDAYRFMSYAYNVKGDIKSAKAAVEEIPEFYFTKLQVAAQVLTGEEQLRSLSTQKWLSFETLLEMMVIRISCYEKTGETVKALNEANTALAIFDAMKNSKNADMHEDFDKGRVQIQEIADRISNSLKNN